jgi:hypothetical protein
MNNTDEKLNTNVQELLNKIPRYDPNWSWSYQQMERHPFGDYVEFDDCKTAVLEAAKPPASYSLINNEVLADLYIQLSGTDVHGHDCATSVAPAETPGPCDCKAASSPSNSAKNGTPDKHCAD